MIDITRTDHIKADLSGCSIEMTIFYTIWQREVWVDFGTKSNREIQRDIVTFISQLKIAGTVRSTGRLYINVSTREFIEAAHRATNICKNLGIDVTINI